MAKAERKGPRYRPASDLEARGSAEEAEPGEDDATMLDRIDLEREALSAPASVRGSEPPRAPAKPPLTRPSVPWIIGLFAIGALFGALGASLFGSTRAPVSSGLEAPSPAHGGVVGLTSEHAFELVVHEDGLILVHLREGELDVLSGLSVSMRDTDGEVHIVSTRFDDAVFSGRLEHATPAVGAAELILVHAGRRERVTLELERLLPGPEREGSVVVVDGIPLEVLLDSEGRAHAWPLSGARLDVELTLNVAGDDGRLHPLPLVWDEETEHWVGRLEGLAPRPGPLEVVVERGGEQRLGRGRLLGVALPRPAALEAPDALGDLRLEPPTLGRQLPAVIPVPVEGDGSDEEMDEAMDENEEGR